MKNRILLVAALLVASVAQVLACTNFIVGKGASKDGSVIVSYSADSYGMFGELYHFPAAKHQKGDMRKIYDWDSGKFLGEIKEASETYNVIGNMNEFQVTIGETTFGGREELSDPHGIMDYGSLIYVALQRSRTAKEAIKVMTDLVKEYGYYSSGESFSIADPNEAWIMEMIGKGPGGKGAVWVAVRIPDDCIAAHANQARIHQFPLNDKDNCIYSPDVISFAREKGYFNGLNKNFSFADAYCPLDFGGLRACEARVWSFYNMFCSGMGEMYLPYIQGKSKEPMPLYAKPDKKISVRDIQWAMRDHYEGTALDITNDVGATAYKMPYRLSPLTFEVNGQKYFNERPISTQQSAFAFVAQMRANLPDAIGGVLWFGTDDAATSPLTPIYANSTEIPWCFDEANGSMLKYSDESMFWITNRIAQFAYLRYDVIGKHVRSEIDKWENAMLEQVKTIDIGIANVGYNPKKAAKIATKFSVSAADLLFNYWKKLDDYLMVKYIDGNVKSEDENGFIENGNGKDIPAKIQQPGYSEKWKRAVAADNGTVLKVVK